MSQANPAGRLTPQQAWEILAEVQAGEHHDEWGVSWLWSILSKLSGRVPLEADEIDYGRRLIEERVTEGEYAGNVLEAFDVRVGYSRDFHTEATRFLMVQIGKHGVEAVGSCVGALEDEDGPGWLNAFVDAEFEAEAEALQAKAAPAGTTMTASRRPRSRGSGRRSRSQAGRRSDGRPREDGEPGLARRPAGPPQLHLILELEQDPIIRLVAASDLDTRRLIGWLRNTDWLQWLPAAVLAAVDETEYSIDEGRR